ncbi:phosphotransferase [Paenibacillus cellulosilyticus]|uniref:phosphotransferase n=1 Tax=Paenibacillus cellulosilyticus TaxID=375489 RepID=UPI00157FC9EB|nr:phosphotransferase [Paenibacillus cellulosilyticus]
MYGTDNEQVIEWVNTNYHSGDWCAACIVRRSNRGVWKLHDGRDTFALKILNGTFPILLQHNLGSMRVAPEVIRTRSDMLHFHIANSNQYGYLARWIQGTVTLDPYCYIRSVARFHQAARWTYETPTQEAYGPSTPKQWFAIYERKLMKLRRWASNPPALELGRTFQHALELANTALVQLQSLNSELYINESVRRGTITHFDLHRGNVICWGSEARIVDFDSSQISLQVCDLHQVISDMQDKMSLSPDRIGDVLNEYFLIHPEARSHEALYRGVCRFPHWFVTIAERAEVAADSIRRNLFLHTLPVILEAEKKKMIYL